MKYKTARLMVKYPDMCIVRYRTEDGSTVGGRIPKIFSREEFIDIDIDLETGQILNWEPPTEEEINDM